MPRIAALRTYLVAGTGKGGDYHRQSGGHWIIDTLIANPMSGYEAYKASRTSWGIGVLGSIVVEIETEPASWASRPGSAGRRPAG